jgi:hypothetical protein
MSLFKLSVKIRTRIDQLRKYFLWYGGSNVKKKYALIAWPKTKKWRIMCYEFRNYEKYTFSQMDG